MGPDVWAWFILISAIFLFVVYAFFVSRRDKGRQQRHRHRVWPQVDPPLVAGRTYNLQMSDGRKISGFTVEGIHDGELGPPWYDIPWLAGTVTDGRRVYLRANAIRTVEEPDRRDGR
ncbi:MAG: hypothetical protein WD009_03405 [Phycisphaeraceae bacterium]